MTTRATSDAFALLGLTPGATKSEIRKAWRALVRAYHPDQTTGCKAEANRRLTEINLAFELVSAWAPSAAPKPQPQPKAEPKPRAAKADTTAHAERKAQAAARQRAEANARRNAERMARAEAADRAQRAAEIKRTPETRAATLARSKFVAALRTLDKAVAPELLRFV